MGLFKDPCGVYEEIKGLIHMVEVASTLEKHPPPPPPQSPPCAWW